MPFSLSSRNVAQSEELAVVCLAMVDGWPSNGELLVEQRLVLGGPCVVVVWGVVHTRGKVNLPETLTSHPFVQDTLVFVHHEHALPVCENNR